MPDGVNPWLTSLYIRLFDGSPSNFSRKRRRKVVRAVIVGRELACRQQADFIDLVDAALGVDVEGADAVDLVVEQVDAIWQCTAHREQVDDAATEAVFAGRYHLGDMASNLPASAGLRSASPDSFSPCLRKKVCPAT